MIRSCRSLSRVGDPSSINARLAIEDQRSFSGSNLCGLASQGTRPCVQRTWNSGWHIGPVPLCHMRCSRIPFKQVFPHVVSCEGVSASSCHFPSKLPALRPHTWAGREWKGVQIRWAIRPGQPLSRPTVNYAIDNLMPAARSPAEAGAGWDKGASPSISLLTKP